MKSQINPVVAVVVIVVIVAVVGFFMMKKSSSDSGYVTPQHTQDKVDKANK
jgi:hypothetical protein